MVAQQGGLPLPGRHPSNRQRPPAAQALAEAAAGRLPTRPPIEVYWHTEVDPGSRGPAGEHSAALFVQGVPYTPAGSSWEAEQSGYVEHLLSLVDEFAPGSSFFAVEGEAGEAGEGSLLRHAGCAPGWAG